MYIKKRISPIFFLRFSSNEQSSPFVDVFVAQPMGERERGEDDQLDGGRSPPVYAP